jgi:hypothetical protein
MEGRPTPLEQPDLTPDDYLTGHDLAQQLFAAIATVVGEFGEVTIHTSKSQIAFRRRRNFAWVWIPGKYLRGRGAPLVLTLVFAMRMGSPRWKEVVQPRPGFFTHHLELFRLDDIDEEVRAWLRAAYEAA